MTKPMIRLAHGARLLDLNDLSKYFLHEDFTPPTVEISPTLAGGSSANRYSGARLIGTRANNKNFAFTVNIKAASEREMSRAIADIQMFLGWSGDESEPLYLEFKPTADVPYQPLWGQNGWLRYIVEFGTARIFDEYSVGVRKAEDIDVALNLSIRPHALGLRQRLASATGGILEDTTGAVDGQSRGTIIPEATTNKMTNPVFGHSTYNNGWTAGTNLIISKNTDERFLLPGTAASVKITRAASVAGQSAFYQSINVGDTNPHAFKAYVKKPDGTAVTSANVVLMYSAALTTTYVHVGDGWYELTATASGIASSTVTGVIVASAAATIYLAFYQTEEKAYHTPPCWGDLLGCAWTGTAHASTSTRTAARARIATSDSLNVAQGTIRIVWKPDANQDRATNRYLMNVTGLNFYVVFLDSSNVFQFADDINTATSPAQTFNAGDIIVLHAVYGPSGLVLYRDGTSIGTNATYTPPALAGADVYIGSNDAATLHGGGTFMDFTTFDQALTATQVANDYANIAQLTADDQRVGCIPWLWSSDGDDDVVNHDDADTNDDNWIVCGGIPGSAPAVTFIAGETNAASGWLTFPRIYLWLLTLKEFLSPTGVVNDLSGTVDANSSGGQYQLSSISTSVSDLTFTPTETLRLRYYKELLGKEIAFLIRLYDEGSNLQLASYLLTPIALTSDYKSLTTAAAFRLFQSPFVALQDSPPGFIDYDISPSGFEFGIRLKRSTGTANVRIDYIMPVFRPFLSLHDPATLIDSKGFYYQSHRASVYNQAGAGDPFQFPLSVNGDVIELMPERYNVLLALLGDTTHDPTIATVLTYAKIVVTPRWSLL